MHPRSRVPWSGDIVAPGARNPGRPQKQASGQAPAGAFPSKPIDPRKKPGTNLRTFHPWSSGPKLL
jgi:hypothetical protein